MHHRIASSVLLLATLGLPARSIAQEKPSSTVTVTSAVTGLHQFDSQLRSGGAVRMSGVSIAAGVTRQWIPALSAGLSLRDVSEEWRFASSTMLAGGAPWRNLRRSSVGLSSRLALSRTVLVGVSPSVEWAYDKRAGTGDAATYGGALSVVKLVRPGRTLGAGANIQRQFYSVKLSPFVVVNWKLDDRWRIANAPSTSPEGGGGVELRWASVQNWELAAGGVIRSQRYRLADSGTSVGRIGEYSSIPLFARCSRNLGARFKADLYLGAAASGRLRIRDSSGRELASVGSDTAPAMAATLSLR